MSGPAGALHVAVRLPSRTAEPAGQLSRGVGCRHPRVQQVRGGVDPLGEHVTTSATGRPTNRHVTNILLDMSHRRTDTPRQFDTPIAQRHLKAEVANCVGGVLSPLLANIALHALDEHVHRPWTPGGIMSTPRRRARRRAKDLPNWRIVRYADDFVVLVHGNQADVEALREVIADVLAPLGLRLSEAKTRITHMSDGFDFLGFRIQWRRKRGTTNKRGTTKWYVYIFIADRPIRSLKNKIRALTGRLSQQPPRTVLIRLNQIMRGWSNYFRHAVAKHTMNALENFVWHRVIRWFRKLHRWNWRDVRRHHTGPHGRWTRPTADGIELFNLAKVPITRYRYRGTKIPNPWVANHA